MQFVMANIKVISYEEATGKLKDIYDGLIDPWCTIRKKAGEG